MFFYVYLLKSYEYDKLYVGSTNDLRKRLKEHNYGLNQSTKPYKPWKLIYYEACLNITDAKRRERYLKTNQGSRMIKCRLKDYFYSF
jgi:putative endonuclease